MAQVVQSGERGYFRVRSVLGLRLQPIEPDRWELEEKRILADRSDPTEGIYPDLARWLERLEHKLDLVLAKLDVEPPAGAERPPRREVRLSGSGIGLDEDDRLRDGDAVLIELELDGEPPVRLNALGRVRVAPPGEGASPVEIGFDVIREVDRDHVIEYTLDMERCRIRAQAAADSP